MGTTTRPTGFLPLSQYLGFWPDHLFHCPEFLNEIGVTYFEIDHTETTYRISGEVAWLQELIFHPLGIDSVAIAFLNQGGMTAVKFELDVFKMEFSLNDLSLSLRITSNLLRPAILEGGKWKPLVDSSGHPKQLEITLNHMNLSFDLDGKFDFHDLPSLSLSPFLIGETGLVMQAEEITPHLSQGAGPRGLSIKKLKLYFPPEIDLPLQSISLSDGFIGAGGFSGTITVEGGVSGQILGISFELKRLSLTFVQNMPTASEIAGVLKIESFEKPIDLLLSLKASGGFTVRLSGTSPEVPFATLTKKDLLELSLKSLSLDVEKKQLKVSGSLQINKPQQWPKIDFEELTIDSQGKLSIPSGWLTFPVAKSIDFSGFKLELSKLGFGTKPTPWVGFSGGIQLMESLPLKGSVEGLKIDLAPPFSVKLEGIEVSFEVKNVLYFDGKVNYFEGKNDITGEVSFKGFKGGVNIIFYALHGMALNAQIMVGKGFPNNPSNFFFLFIDVQLPIGIPLGSTGLALYGMAGLVGYNIRPDREESWSWFEWYKGAKEGQAPSKPEGLVDVKKWTPELNHFAFGAGLTLGTFSDNGYTFSVNALLLVLVPGPVILLEGRANFLKERAQTLKELPPLRMLAVFDPQSGTILMNVIAQYKIPDSGDVLSAYAEAEAYFNFHNPGAWHFYLGQETPLEKRVQGEIFHLFQSSSYLMISGQSFNMGAWAGFDKSWHAGPLKIALQAYIEGAVNLSYKPVQLWGRIAFGGNIELSAFGHGLGISLSSEIEVSIPNPKYIHAEFDVKLNLPWPLPDPKAHIVLEWAEPQVPECINPLKEVSLEHFKTTKTWTPSTQEDTNLPVVPLDVKIALNFMKSVHDAATSCQAAAAPIVETVDSYQFEYELASITLEKKEGNQWERAVIGKSEDSNDSLFYGSWQAVPNPSGQVENTHLMLWANTPFAYARSLENSNSFLFSVLESNSNYPCNWPNDRDYSYITFAKADNGIHDPSLSYQGLLFYASRPLETKHCLQWANLPAFTSRKISALFLSVSTANTDLRNNPLFRTLISEEDNNTVLIVFPQEIAEITFHFAPVSQGKMVFLDNEGRPCLSQSFSCSGESDFTTISMNDFYARYMLLKGSFFLLEIKLLSKAEKIRSQKVSDSFAHMKQSTEDHWKEKRLFLLQANTTYRLVIQTMTTRSGQPQPFSSSYYFRTGYPPRTALSNAEEVFENLAPYIETTTPKVAALNEPLHPAYRGYDVGIVFNEPEGFIEELYRRASFGVEIELFDANGRLEETRLNTWGISGKLAQTEEMQKWKEIADRSGHLQLNFNSIPHKADLFTKAQDTWLKPCMTYKARLSAFNSLNRYSLYEFNFLTSRYVSFTHHIQSFQDAVWDYAKLGADLSSIPWSSILSQDFQTLSRLFHLENRPPLEQVEILLLSPYGLFLESPEPLEWNRLSVDLYYLDNNHAVEEILSSVKILDIGTHSTYTSVRSEIPPSTDEWLEILLLQPTNLSGWSIHKKSSEEADFSVFFTFETEKLSPEGTILHIHTQPPSAQIPSDEFVHYYAGVDNSSTTLLTSSPETTIRLLDGQGNIVHERTLFNRQWESNALRKTFFISSADGSKTFIFCTDAQNNLIPFQTGLYRLKFQFNRDIGENTSLLKQKSQTTPEITAIEFSLPSSLPKN